MRYFDTAPYYGSGLAEQRLGRALRGRPRDEFVVSTKVGRLLRHVPARFDPVCYGAPPLQAYFDFSPTAHCARSTRASSGSASTGSTSPLIHDPDDHYDEALAGRLPSARTAARRGRRRARSASA